MPNWSKCKLKAHLPSDNASIFISLFLTGDYEEDHKREKCFYRSYLSSYSVKPSSLETSEIEVEFECAWSIYDCLLSSRLKEENDRYQNIEDVVNSLNITYLFLFGKEPGCNLSERVYFDKGKGDKRIRYSVDDLY